MRGLALVSSFLLLATAGCLQASSTGTGLGGEQQQGCGAHCGKTTFGNRGSSTGAATSNSGSRGSSGGATGGSTGSSATAAGSSSGGGGSSGGQDITGETFCTGVAVTPPTQTCPTGTPFASQLVDILTCTVIPGATIAAVGSNGVPVTGASATTANDGSFGFCLPTDNNPFSLQATVADYPTTYYAEMLNPDVGSLSQIGVLSQTTLDAFSSFVQGGIDTTKGLVIVKLTGTDCVLDYTGWSFAVTLPGGGAVPDGGFTLAYLSSNYVPDPTATATANNGVAMIVNIDTTLSSFFDISGTNAGPDAGPCGVIINDTVGLTGRVFVAGSAVTVDPILLN